jgi:ABC-type phosphate transport system ATPase subunit
MTSPPDERRMHLHVPGQVIEQDHSDIFLKPKEKKTEMYVEGR